MAVKPKNTKRELENERTALMLKAANRLISHLVERFNNQMGFKRSRNKPLNEFDKETLDKIEKYRILKTSLQTATVEEVSGASHDLLHFDSGMAQEPDSFKADRTNDLDEWGVFND